MDANDKRAVAQLGALVGTGELGEQRTELTAKETGQWLVLSATSAHFFDLDARRVLRIPGSDAMDFVTDVGRELRTLDTCRVGARGQWTMEPLRGDELTSFAWHISTEIVMIAKVLGLTRLP